MRHRRSVSWRSAGYAWREEATPWRECWAGLPVIATVARLLCRDVTLQNEYLRLENDS